MSKHAPQRQGKSLARIARRPSNQAAALIGALAVVGIAVAASNPGVRARVSRLLARLKDRGVHAGETMGEAARSAVMPMLSKLAKAPEKANGALNSASTH